MDRYNRLIGSTAQKNDIIEIRGIKIDKTARRVWVNGEETTFTTKEFDLLSFLAQNPNRVFTKGRAFPGNLGYGICRGYCHCYGPYQENP